MPIELQKVETPRISRQTTREGGKVVNTRHRPLYSQEMYLVLISVRGRVDPRAIVQTGRFKLMRNTNDHIGNRNRDFPAYSAVHQPTAPPRNPRAPEGWMNKTNSLM
jgi:hypothetical protein